MGRRSLRTFQLARIVVIDSDPSPSVNKMEYELPAEVANGVSTIKHTVSEGRKIILVLLELAELEKIVSWANALICEKVYSDPFGVVT
jgi:hypothetical protein